MADYSKMIQDDFDRLLAEIIDESPASCLLSIPGVYELLSEHYNNDVLNAWVSICGEED